MHNYFELLTNKGSSLSGLSFEPEEIDMYLNQSMFRFIEQRAYGGNPKRESLEETQKRVDDLRNLIKSYNTSTFTTNSDNKVNGKFVNLPTGYRHAIQEECLITYNNCNNISSTKRVDVVPITHDRYNKIKKDPWNKPYEDLVIRLSHEEVSSNEVFELITDGSYTVTTYYLTYLKTPAEMRYGTTYDVLTTDVQCELSEHTHREIVELAARIAIETIESPRVATYPQIQKETE